METISRLVQLAQWSKREACDAEAVRQQLSTEAMLAGFASVSNVTGRIVLEVVINPGCIQRHQAALRQVIMDLVIPELDRQARRLHDACVRLQIHDAVAQWSRRGLTSEQQRAKTEAEEQLHAVRSETWPRNTVEHLPRLVHAILGELSELRQCPSCRGVSDSAGREKRALCRTCAGLGVKTWCDRHRAQSIHCDHAGYSRRWKVVYEWIYIQLLHAMRDASKQFFNGLAHYECD